MSDQVRQIKQKADIVAIINERVKLKKAGRNFQALCPFHSEKTPSFNVSPELQIFKCFGCSESGDVFSFLEKFEGMTFPEALRYVADRVGIKLTEFQQSRDYMAREKLLAILNLAAEFYHYLLINHRIGEEARQYLKNRGVWKRTMEIFQLGYAPDSWEVLQKYLVDKKGYRREDLGKVGLVIKKQKFYDRFRGRIMFPLTNQRGQVLGFAGRVLDPKVKRAKYVNTPETSLYHKSELLYGLSVTKSEIKKKDGVIVVEGEFDALSSWQAGAKNVVAIKGSALTEDQMRLLGRYSKNLLLALDADQAGEESTKRGIALADKLGMDVRVVILSGGKDPDEIVQGDKKKWKQLIGKAMNSYDFYLKTVLTRWDKTTGEGKRRISRELVPILSGISNKVEQAHYVRKLAKELQVPEEVVAGEIERVIEGLERTDQSTKEVKQEEKEEGRVLEEYVLALLLKSKNQLLSRLKSLDKEWFQCLAVKRVVEALQEKSSQRFLKNEGWSIRGFVENLAAELRELVERVWLLDLELENEVIGEREFNKTMRDLRRKYVRRRLQRLAEKIEQLEGKRKMTDREERRLQRLQKQFVEISQELQELI